MIDRKRLVEELSNNFRVVQNDEDLEWNRSLDKAILIVNAQPTAYDVDKVMEKLEASCQGAYDSKNLPKFSAYNQAIEIVKAGGMNEH